MAGVSGRRARAVNVWREAQIAELLGREHDRTVDVSGTVSNQGQFYPRLDAVVLLSGPATRPVDVVVDRLIRLGEAAAEPKGRPTG
jgi:hypothetical protein